MDPKLIHSQKNNNRCWRVFFFIRDKLRKQTQNINNTPHQDDHVVEEFEPGTVLVFKKMKQRKNNKEKTTKEKNPPTEKSSFRSREFSPPWFYFRWYLVCES